MNNFLKNCFTVSLTVSSGLLLSQGGGAFGHSGEEIHLDPAEIHQERVEAGKDCLRRHSGVCPLLVTIRLRHAHFMGRVGLINGLTHVLCFYLIS